MVPAVCKDHGGNNMWTETTRRQYRPRRSALSKRPGAKRLGRPRRVPLGAVVEALLYLLRTASPWRLLLHAFPNRSTVQRYFYAWQSYVFADGGYTVRS